MHTSILVLALMGPGAAPAFEAPEAPSWQESYRTAREVGRKQGKPLAVFIGSGPTGWAQLLDDKKVSRQARQLLSQHYVCVYVDQTRGENKSLASAFEVTDGPGLVISTKDGQGQAFSHKGTMTSSELTETLNKFAVDRTVTRTETLNRARYTLAGYPDASMRPVSSSNGVSTTSTAGNILPVQYSTPTQSTYTSPYGAGMATPSYTPTYSGGFGGYGGFSGGFGGGYSSGGC